VGAIIAALPVIVGALAFIRDGNGAKSAAIFRLALVLLLALAGGWMLDYFWRRDLAAEGQNLEARAFQLKSRALAPGSALACLDPITGAEMEESCEKALFASPEATAAAISYVATQMALLSSARDHAQRSGLGDADVFTDLRRALEADQFGVVAYVLTVRDHCSARDCAALALLHDSSRVSANIEQRRFETHLKRHMAAWSGAANGLVNNHPVASGPAVAPNVAGVSRSPNKLFFPSASSIPPVNIMAAEPAAPRQPSTEPAAASEPAAPPRRPASNAPSRQPPNPGPTSLTPPGIQ
jgi:hypothetical protein